MDWMSLVANGIEAFKLGIFAVVVVVLVAVAPKAVAWLKAKANTVKWLEAMQIDDAILDALGDAVSNIGNGYVKDLKEANEDGKLTDTEKAAAKERAIIEATAILKSKGIELAKEKAPDAIAAIIRRIVDRKNDQ